MSEETTVTVVGNLTADPELHYTGNGTAVANFTIASTPRSFDKATNGWKDGDALFLRCAAWRDFAEHVAGSLTKGSRVVATGRLRQRSFETKEGEKRISIELEIDEIGPSLRYATATVTRTAASAPKVYRETSAEVWPPSTADASQQPQDAPRAASVDVWRTPANYNNSEPF